MRGNLILRRKNIILYIFISINIDFFIIIITFCIVIIVAPQRRVATQTFIWGTSMILDDSASLGLLGTIRSCVVS